MHGGQHENDQLAKAKIELEGSTMNSRIRCSVVLAMIVLVSFQVRAVRSGTGSLLQGPHKSYKGFSHETHERVLDILFQRDEANRDYDLVLRFEPSFAPESQIVVRTAANKVEVVEYASLSGNIYRQLDSVMAHGGKEDPVEMAKLIQVRKRLIEVSHAQAKQWRRSLAVSVAASIKTLERRSVESERGIGTIALDGTFYHLWYDQVGSHLSFSLLDHEASDRGVTGELELVRWMNSVRLNVAKRK